MDNHQGLNIFVVRRFDEQLAANLSRAAGLSIRLVSYRSFNSAPVDALTSLHSAGLADGRYAVAHIQKLDLYAASFPLFTNTGEVIALIEARLPAAQIDSEIRSLIHRLLVTALILALVAVLAGAVLGQFVAGPVQDLTGGGGPPRTGRLLDLDSGRGHCGSRCAGAHHGRHAAQPGQSHRHAAASRGRSPGRAGRESSKACSRWIATATSAT